MHKIAVVIMTVSLLNGCDSCGRKQEAPSAITNSDSVSNSQPAQDQSVSNPAAATEPSASVDIKAEPTTAVGESTGTGTGVDTGKIAAKVHKFESKDIKVGSGATATEGKSITIHYVGTFETGIKFDSSIDRESPLTFTLGKGEQIKGWDQGIQGMKVGGKRHLVVPPELGYGATGVKGVIPPNSTLFFEVELLSVK